MKIICGKKRKSVEVLKTELGKAKVLQMAERKLWNDGYVHYPDCKDDFMHVCIQTQQPVFQCMCGTENVLVAFSFLFAQWKSWQICFRSCDVISSGDMSACFLWGCLWDLITSVISRKPLLE